MRPLLVLAVVAGCGRVGFDGVGQLDGADRTDGKAGNDAPLGAWSAPTLIPGLTGRDDPSITADQLELFSNVDTAVEVSVRTAATDPWPPGVSVALGATFFSPHISADGLTLWGVNATVDIVVTTRTTRTSAWVPFTVITEVSTTATDDGPAVTSDGLAMVLDSSVTGGGDLFLSTRSSIAMPWSTPTPITELNTSGLEARPHLSDDKLTIYFQIGGDLAFAHRPTTIDPFGPSELLTVLDSTGFEQDPWVSADERHLLFASNRTGPTVLWESSR